MSDINYRCHILNKILKENKIISKSGDIFQILFQNNYKKIFETFEQNLNNNNFILKYAK